MKEARKCETRDYPLLTYGETLALARHTAYKPQEYPFQERLVAGLLVPPAPK